MPKQSQKAYSLREEIQKLVACIDKAKQEIGGMVKGEENATGDAVLQLDAVIKATEEASNTIMDAADKIQASVAGVGGDKEKQIMDATNTIYDACNFQDLTGQRINKVMRVVKEVDEGLQKIVSLFGTVPMNPSAPLDPLDEKALLNGPQLPGNATSQEDIDALFSGKAS